MEYFPHEFMFHTKTLQNFQCLMVLSQSIVKNIDINVKETIGQLFRFVKLTKRVSLHFILFNMDIF